MIERGRILLLLVALASAIVPSSPARAVTAIWDGGGSNDNWTTGANWFALFGPGVAPPNDGTADIVMPAAGGLVQTPLVNVPYSIDSLAFGSGNGRFVILAASELTIGAGGITNNDADIQSIIGPVRLSANETWNAAAGPLQIDTVNFGTSDLDLAGAYPIDLISAISGSGLLRIANGYTSTVTMSGAASNSYSDSTEVRSGTLVLQKSAGTVAIPGDLHIFSGATVRLAANEQISHIPNRAVNVHAGALFDVNTRTETVDSLNVNGLVTVGATGKLTADYADIRGTWTNAGSLYIGETADSQLRISLGGDVTSVTGYVGYGAGITGEVTVDGNGSTWTSSLSTHVGPVGQGSLMISGGGLVSSFFGFVGSTSTGTGTVTVTGTNSRWANTNNLFVGAAGDGSLNISDGGQVTNFGGFIADIAGSMGDVTVDGIGSTWMNSGAVYVGNAGNATLNISSGGEVTSAQGVVGYAPTGTGEVTVDGPGSTWTNSGDLFVGYNGNGTLEITNGGNVTNFIGIIGRFTGSASSVIVDGSGSTWTNNGGAAIVGYAGAGTLDVTNGGQVTSRYYGFIGDPTGSSRVTVDGAGSSWTISDLGELDVGSNNGFGTLEVTGGGHVTNVVGFIGKYFGGGAATVDGVGSLWTNSSYLSVAEESDATLDISGGGEVTNTDAYIAWLSDKTGTVTVNGAGSTWTSTGHVSIGSGNAHGKLELSAGGQAASASAVIGYGNGSTGEVAVDGIGSMWTITNDLNVSLDFDGGDANLTVTNGGVVSAASVIVGEFGSLHGDGNIVGIVENGGLVSPGTSPGALTIDGDYLQTAIGELVIELASASSYDQLLVTDNATLGGTLTVNLIDGFTPTIGQMFTILTADDVDETFDMALLPTVPNLSFEVTYNAQSVVLSVVPALDGDYNADGTVDAADYVVWRKNAGTQAGYDTWRAHFGATAGSGAAAANGLAEASPSQTAVPEPSSMILMCGSVLLALFIKQRGKGRMCAVSELAGKSAGRPGD